MPCEQGESEEFVETLAPEDVLDVFDAVNEPVVLSADVADHFGVTRETARRKLKQLSDQGVLDRRKVSRRVIYWRADGDGFDGDGLQGDASTTLADDTAGHAGESDGDNLTTLGVTVDRMLADTDAEDTATPDDATDTETTAKETNAESAPTRTESNVVNHDEWHDQIAEEVAGVAISRTDAPTRSSRYTTTFGKRGPRKRRAARCCRSEHRRVRGPVECMVEYGEGTGYALGAPGHQETGKRPKQAVVAGSMTTARDQVFKSSDSETRTLYQVCYYG